MGRSAAAPFGESTPQTIKIRAKRAFWADGNLEIPPFEHLFVPTPNSSYYNYYSHISSWGPFQISSFRENSCIRAPGGLRKDAPRRVSMSGESFAQNCRSRAPIGRKTFENLVWRGVVRVKGFHGYDAYFPKILGANRGPKALTGKIQGAHRGAQGPKWKHTRSP